MVLSVDRVLTPPEIDGLLALGGIEKVLQAKI